VKQGYDCVTIHHLNDDRKSFSETHHLEFWTQPWLRWMWWQVYHWYDMRIYRVPGFKLLERFIWWFHRNNDFYIPLGAQQDCRCYELSIKRRTELARVDIDKETYDRLSTRKGAT
jgi:hypothetical protein